MAKLINPEYDHHYLSFTQATRLFSAVQSCTFEESKDRDFVRRIDKASETIQVTKLRNAVKQLIDMADLQPVYEITSTLALVNPRYEFNQLMGLFASKHVNELSDDLVEQVQAFKKFYESIISDEHVRTVADGGTLATPFMKYLTPADFQRAENGEIGVDVTYTANDQTAGIKIIDDTTGKVLNTQSATGKFGTEIQFKQNPDQQVIDLQAQHYELVSDNFKHQAYKSDNAQNQFEIHVRHQTADTQRTDAVTETVHYRDNHGNQLRPDTQATKTFTQSGVLDKVTGDIAWNPVTSQTIDSVTAPEITGYTPDRNSVPAVIVNFGDNDIDQTIVYTPVQEPASIKYVDDTTGKTLLTDHTTGDFGTQINFDHDPIAQIGQYESQGYKLVSNNYGNSAHQFSATASENNFEVHLTHGTKDAVRTSTVTRVINYVDSATGEKLRPSTTQTLTFTEHGVLDEVTGKTTWTDSPVQHFAKIATPEIEGYTTEVKTVDSVAAHFGDDDLEVNVPYTKVVVPDTPETPGTPDQPGTPKTPSTPEQPETPSQPGTPQLPEQPVAPTARQANHAQPAANNATTATTATELPQTGDDSQRGATLAGLGLIGMMGALFGFKKKA